MPPAPRPRRRIRKGESVEARIRAYAAENRAAARIIYADSERYDGLPLMWACLVLGLPKPDLARQAFFEFPKVEQMSLWVQF